MLKMKRLSSIVTAGKIGLLIAAVAAAGMSGCSNLQRGDGQSPPVVGDIPAERPTIAIEQSGVSRDVITGERKFVFCSGKGCEPVTRKVSAQGIRPGIEMVPKKDTKAMQTQIRPEVKTFQVGFDYDKSTLNETGIQVMEDAANFAIDSKAEIIRIHGKADSYNRDAYNLKLAERRARTAERFMKSKNISASLIVDSSIVRVTADGAYPPGETFKGRRVDLDIVIEIVPATTK